MTDYGTMLKPCAHELVFGAACVPWEGRWWRPRTVSAHMWAVRLCALVYFFAFLGIVMDGPIMWALMPPEGGWSAEERIDRSRIGMVLALTAVLLPRLWPALAFCWPLWHNSHVDGGSWFGFGWDPMLDDVGFLSILLSMTLTLYDDLVEEQAHDALFAKQADSAAQEPSASDASAQSTAADDGSLKPLLGADKSVRLEEWMPSPQAVAWCVLAAELAQTFSAFRLFSVAGILKKKQGSECWRDYTCLYTHFYTQPMPNPLAWYFHNWTSPGLKMLMQWFAIDVGECLAPYLLLGCLLSTGLLGALHKEVRRSDSLWWLVAFPARLVGSLLMAALLIGMFVSGNYAFLHPLSLVCLLASCGTARCVPMVRRDRGFFLPWYRLVTAWVVIVLAVFAVLPGCSTLQWILAEEADTIGNVWSNGLWPVTTWIKHQPFVEAAATMNLGMDHFRYAYFAGAVESREEYVYTAQLGDEWVEFDVPCKVGSVDRSPCITSPLHRRFAWQLWFPFGDGMFDYYGFFEKICKKDEVFLRALEMGALEEGLKKHELKAVAKQAFSYHFTQHGEQGWWTRKAIRDREVHLCTGAA